MQRVREAARAWCTGLLLLAAATSAVAQQQRWVVDSKTSIAWWQMNPTLGHLWATTCPDDPSWVPGEGNTIGQIGHILPAKATVKSDDETRIPLYPRRTVRSLCQPALRGEIVVGDTLNGRSVHGSLTLEPTYLVTGSDFRDKFGRKAIFDIEQYPNITITIDSLINEERGTPRKAVAVGTWEFRGIKSPMQVPVTLEPQPGGALRVQGHFAIPASDLVHKYGVSPFTLGLSVGLRVWKTLHLGMDLLMRPQTASP